MFVVIMYYIPEDNLSVSKICFKDCKEAEAFVSTCYFYDKLCESEGDYIYKIVEFPELAKRLNETR